MAISCIKTLKNLKIKIALYILLVLLMSNLNSFVDAVLHPDIPYFDEEHLIFGGITGLLTAIVFGVLFIYTCRLEIAFKRISLLESILPICTNCKSIQLPETDPHKQTSWEKIESYISDQTGAEFSKELCPRCSHLVIY